MIIYFLAGFLLFCKLLNWWLYQRLKVGQIWLNAQSAKLYIILEIHKEYGLYLKVMDLHSQETQVIGDYCFKHYFKRII